MTNSDATPGANGQKLGDGVDPKLDPSGLDNGGPTDTIALQPTSPAIDAIPTSSGQCPATDQRGFARPDADADDSATPACDIGAFESAHPDSNTHFEPEAHSVAQEDSNPD